MTKLETITYEGKSIIGKKDIHVVPQYQPIYHLLTAGRHRSFTMAASADNTNDH